MSYGCAEAVLQTDDPDRRRRANAYDLVCGSQGKIEEVVPEGSGANFLKCMFLSGEKALQILGGQDRGPNFRSGGCFSG
jgi:hypothetical protein